MKPHPVVIVWQDAKADAPGWKPLDESTLELTLECSTVAYLIHRDRRTLVLCRTINEQGETEGRFAIPRGFVKEVKKLHG